MLLQALYDYSQKHHLFDSLPLQKRIIHFLIPLKMDGTLRDSYFIPLTQTNAKGKEELGQEHIMPRFPGENNGGKAYFLAEGTIPIFGRDKESGQLIPSPKSDPKMKDKNPTKSFLYFWEQITNAYQATQDTRLEALLLFRKNYITEKDELIFADLPFLKVITNKNNEPVFVGITGSGNNDHSPLKHATLGFQIDGIPLTLKDDSDPLMKYWFSEFRNNAFTTDNQDEDSAECDLKPTICLITGKTGVPIARSHKPKILGVPGLTSGGYIVSFAKEAPAFSSYGFEMGHNASVSEEAAASYALATNEMLSDDDMHINLGPISICFWAREIQEASKHFNFLLNKAFTEQVAQFLKSPFAGIADREIINRDKMHTIAFSGNAGRVVVQYWIEQPLYLAIENYTRWWNHLNIVSLSKKDNNKYSPYAIPTLARVCIRKSKKHKDDKLIAERIVRLYRVAMEGANLPISLLKVILDEFYSALVKDSEEEKLYPFNTSRFALIKLILIRNRKEGDFMPTYELSDTPDPAYNLGRLLAVFESLQDKYHNYELKGAGVVERYYSTASSSPASAFPLLCRLARHHLSKLKKGSEDDKKAAYRIEERIIDILSKFRSNELGKPPVFPRILTLERQGRFALGFYQQKAQDNQNKLSKKNDIINPVNQKD